MHVARPNPARGSCVLGLVLVVGLANPLALRDARSATDAPHIRGEFSLVDHHGRSVSEESYRGRWLLVFFGYTHCPDICPTTLMTVSSVLASLGDDADAVQALFITVDPERDTPARLREYLTAFRSPVTGLTGTPAQVEAAASFLARYRKVRVGDQPDAYTFDHSAYLYPMNPSGEFSTAFGFGESAAHMTDEIRRHLSH